MTLSVLHLRITKNGIVKLCRFLPAQLIMTLFNYPNLPEYNFYFNLKIFKKRMEFTVLLIPRHSIEAYGMKALEDTLFDTGIFLFELFKQQFNFLPL